MTSIRVFMLRAEALGAILISYCNRVGMPLRRNANKSVRIERDHVVVLLSHGQDAATAPELPEPAVGRIPEAVRAWSWIEADR